MARVEIDWREARDDTVPQVCVRCGAPAGGRWHKTFRWLPWWQPVLAVLLGVLFLPVGLIPILGRAFYQELLRRLAQPREMTLRVPVCPLHRNHWRLRPLIQWIGFGLLLLGLLAGLLWRRNLPGWYWTALGSAVLVWLLVCAVAHLTMVRAVRITGTSLVLTGVAPAFAEQLEEDRKAGRTSRVARAPRFRVVGILGDGRKRVVGTFATAEEAQECVRFLWDGGQFERVEVEGGEAEPTG
jgi:hypothetical protein